MQLRLLSSQVNNTSNARPTATSMPIKLLLPLRPPFLPSTINIKSITPFLRPFHISPRAQSEEKNANVQEETTEKKETPESEAKEDAKGEGKEGEERSDKTKEKKEDLPPPPPHGDKTPWQVFMETMQTEFNQSKEWNDSTKALASSAHELAESETVRKARQAYEATSGAVSSTAGKVAKTTAHAIGKGAQWTWETPVVKGVRKGANITGEVLDKATKPIRETEAFQNVKNVIDDGSSSRYGGWVDKEERRRRREALEKQNGGKAAEILQEDPE